MAVPDHYGMGGIIAKKRQPITRRQKREARRGPRRKRPPAPAILDGADTKADAPIWANLAEVAGLEPRPDRNIQGASGLTHEVLQIAVDDKNRRLLVVTPDPDPRAAALTQVDIQATLDNTQVLLARPLIVDVGVITRRIVQLLGRESLGIGEIKKHMDSLSNIDKSTSDKFLEEYFGDILFPIKEAFQSTPLPISNQIISFVQQMALLDWYGIMRNMQLDSEGRSGLTISLNPLKEIDTIAADRELGICSIPLYEFDSSAWEIMRSDRRKADVAELLSSLGILQYFFPPPDNTALGLIDRGVGGTDVVLESVKQLPSIGTLMPRQNW